VTRLLFVLGALELVALTSVAGQRVRLRVDGIALTYQEVAGGRDAVGAGGGGGLEISLGRFRLDGRIHSARVAPDSSHLASYDFTQVDVRIDYLLTPVFALEVGGGRRYVRPEFSAQGVGYTRIGIFSENRLHRLASVWVRGAFLPGPRFSGGGTAELAFEFSLGAGVGTANGRFRFHAEFEFQRIDREAGGADVPIQQSLARTGIAIGF
jgi:hypothetical protein